MTALSTPQLFGLLYHPEPSERLVVTPLLDREQQVRHSAIDLRLGSEFIALRDIRLPGLLVDVLEGGNLEKVREEVEGMVLRNYIPLGSSFVLHPGQFVLTASLEYLSIPLSVMAYVVGRSSWGRLGLNIATAPMVAPGFKGSLTFEMQNLGTVPLGLYPGTRVAQLVFHTLGSPEDPKFRYGGPGSKYVVPVGPEFSRIADDQDWPLLSAFRSQVEPHLSQKPAAADSSEGDAG